MEIVYLPVNELNEYEYNPRINEPAVEVVKNSIKEFGFRNPILIDKNNVIVAGHTRKLAAVELGMEEVPCIVISDLSPEKIKGLRLADNKTSEFASWDMELLEKELSELTAFDFDISNFGFDDVFEHEQQTTTYENKELTEEEFAEESYKHECPRCGFMWNDKE